MIKITAEPLLHYMYDLRQFSITPVSFFLSLASFVTFRLIFCFGVFFLVYFEYSCQCQCKWLPGTICLRNDIRLVIHSLMPMCLQTAWCCVSADQLNYSSKHIHVVFILISLSLCYGVACFAWCEPMQSFVLIICYKNNFLCHGWYEEFWSVLWGYSE